MPGTPRFDPLCLWELPSTKAHTGGGGQIPPLPSFEASSTQCPSGCSEGLSPRSPQGYLPSNTTLHALPSLSLPPSPQAMADSMKEGTSEEVTFEQSREFEERQCQALKTVPEVGRAWHTQGLARRPVWQKQAGARCGEL